MGPSAKDHGVIELEARALILANSFKVFRSASPILHGGLAYSMPWGFSL